MRQEARKWAAALCALGLAAGAHESYAKSSTNIVNLANPAVDTTNSLALSYSPSATTQATGILTVNNGTRTADDVAYCVVLTLTNPGQQGGLGFAVVDSATGNVLSLTGSPSSSSQVLSGSFAPGTAANTSRVYSIAFQVFSAALPAPGTYTATINEALYRGSTFPPSGSLVDSNVLTVQITVGSFYDLSIVPQGSAFSLASTSQSLNFGTLSAGLQVGADLLVRSNVSYSISMSSANGGALSNAADPASAVSYSFKSNGTAASLNPGPALVAGGAPATFQNAARYSLVFTVLPLAGNPSAGTYTDTITVNLLSP
jgi:spore coat protein U-like protein